VADLVAYAHQTDEWTLYVSLDDSLGEKTRTRDIWKPWPPITTIRKAGQKEPPLHEWDRACRSPLTAGARSYAYDWRLSLRERPCGISTDTGPRAALAFRKKTSLARDMLDGLQQLLPAGSRSTCSSTVGMPPSLAEMPAAARIGMSFCAIKSNRTLDDKKRSQWPQALRH